MCRRLTQAPLQRRKIDNFARANSRTVDYEIEFPIDSFEFFEADIRVNFAASLEKTRGEIIEVNRRVH